VDFAVDGVGRRKCCCWIGWKGGSVPVETVFVPFARDFLSSTASEWTTALENAGSLPPSGSKVGPSVPLSS